MGTTHPRKETSPQGKKPVPGTRGSKAWDCPNSKAHPRPHLCSTVVEGFERAPETGRVQLPKRGCGGTECGRDSERDWQRLIRNFLRRSQCSRTAWHQDQCFCQCCGLL